MLHCIVQCEPYVFLLFFMILSMGNQIQMDTFITMFEIPFVSLEISSLRQKKKKKKKYSLLHPCWQDVAPFSSWSHSIPHNFFMAEEGYVISQCRKVKPLEAALFFSKLEFVDYSHCRSTLICNVCSFN